MAKFFLLAALAVFVVWLFRRATRARTDASRQADKTGQTNQRPEELMVSCVWCGVNQPLSESILAGERYYCCAEHRQAAESRNP